MLGVLARSSSITRVSSVIFLHFSAFFPVEQYKRLDGGKSRKERRGEMWQPEVSTGRHNNIKKHITYGSKDRLFIQ